MWQFSIFIGNRRKHKTADIWRCANEEQCVPDKTGCSCRTITRSIRLPRQGCWCCACRSSSPVLHESYCRITSGRRSKRWSWLPLDVSVSFGLYTWGILGLGFMRGNNWYVCYVYNFVQKYAASYWKNNHWKKTYHISMSRNDQDNYLATCPL